MCPFRIKYYFLSILNGPSLKIWLQTEHEDLAPPSIVPKQLIVQDNLLDGVQSSIPFLKAKGLFVLDQIIIPSLQNFSSTTNTLPSTSKPFQESQLDFLQPPSYIPPSNTFSFISSVLRSSPPTGITFQMLQVDQARRLLLKLSKYSPSLEQDLHCLRCIRVKSSAWNLKEELPFNIQDSHSLQCILLYSVPAQTQIPTELKEADLVTWE